MLVFENDYSHGAHERVMRRLIETNMEPQSGYGADDYCKSAGDKIRAACESKDAEVFFLVGGTQTNEIVMSTMLSGYQGVIAAETGHIEAHEAGAIEHSGHKVLTLGEHAGKLDPNELEQYVRGFYANANRDCMVFPGMVYISHPTELGTLYTASELKAISDICRSYDMALYLDGARLGCGLMSPDTDVTLPFIAKYCDVFYIGGTKMGALCGEAVVFAKDRVPKHFLTMIKQHGAMLAKGRVLGAQFDALFTDGLYFELGGHAIDMAARLKKVLAEAGYEFFIDSPTNQQFVIVDDEKMRELAKNVRFSVWEKYDDTRTVIRFVTSWATTAEDIEKLRKYL